MAEYLIVKCSMMFTADKLIARRCYSQEFEKSKQSVFCKERNSHARLLIILAFRDLVEKSLTCEAYFELRKSLTCRTKLLECGVNSHLNSGRISFFLIVPVKSLIQYSKKFSETKYLFSRHASLVILLL